jgi:tetratricopeptide (TPR) repeat protein
MRKILVLTLAACCFNAPLAYAQKTEQQLAADAHFIASIDQLYKGDRKTAANDLTQRGWKALREGNPQEAVRRFQQALLLDSANSYAQWGMGAAQGSGGRGQDALQWFAQAERTLKDDTNFEVDYARTQAIAGAQSHTASLQQDALARFARIYQTDPQHTANLQNWAICLFYMESYAEAWKKIQLAESTAGRSALDPGFIAALTGKMARPQ